MEICNLKEKNKNNKKKVKEKKKPQKVRENKKVKKTKKEANNMEKLQLLAQCNNLKLASRDINLSKNKNKELKLTQHNLNYYGMLSITRDTIKNKVKEWLKTDLEGNLYPIDLY